MYPPVSSGTAAIKTQSYSRKSKVFYPTTTSDYNNRPSQEVVKRESGSHPESFAARAGHDSANTVWRTRSSGSNGSSSNTPTSPSVSSPLSRTSSVGSSNGDRPGSGVARQAAVILRSSPPAVYRARLEKITPFMNNKKSESQLHTARQVSVSASRSAKNASSKPFNHKEVLEHMDKAFREAKEAIESGQGKFFDVKEHGSAVAFKPFDWEEFWGQRKMNGL